MIPKETIELVLDTARVEEVVGEFVHLKKRGVNYIGNCPFHDEKTPSFTVSPAKGIYKCFGCSAGGTAVTFLMEHEHYSYPEAIKYLAEKYNIEYEEEELSDEQKQEQSARESLYVVNNFAQKFFIDQLHNTDEGKSVGIGYFKSRGFSDEIIEKFQLGYSPEKFDAFTQKAFTEGYEKEYLVAAGLVKDKNEKLYDAYRGRVIFPIHNLSGRPIGFGGRTLKKDKKVPKYINSPQNDIYDKSKTLYGIYFAKNQIVKQDNCYLVEGYTDVISLHQSGIQNVVASSGTSLTGGQIRLIKRYTNNITILYDGDVAGIKASFRGINLILEEGMNVKVVLFPEGEDPDSFAKNHSEEELQSFIKSNSKDFIVFKTDLLLAETEGDPIKKSSLIHEIVDSIALIPDQITASLYVQECSKLLDISEKALIAELNKAKRKAFKKQHKGEYVPDNMPVVQLDRPQDEQIINKKVNVDAQENAVIELLLNYGTHSLNIEDEESNEIIEYNLAHYVINNLLEDDFEPENSTNKEIIHEYLKGFERDEILNEKHFINHPKEDVRKIAIEIISKKSKYYLHKWETKNIFVSTEEEKLMQHVNGVIYSYKLKRVEKLKQIEEEKLKNKNLSDEEILEALKQIMQLDEFKNLLSAELERRVLR